MELQSLHQKFQVLVFWIRITMRLLTLLTTCLSAAAAATLGKRAPTPGTLSQVTSFGSAPTKAGFFIYVPKKLAASPGIVVAVHYCTGTAQAYYSGSPYASLAEQYGFIVIYPSSPHSGTCWDVSSKATLSHDGGGDSNTIANMVKWTLTQYKADAAKVFVTGSSSGAMMTVSLFAQQFCCVRDPQPPKEKDPCFTEYTDDAAERPGRHIPRHLQGRHRLLRRARRLLRLGIQQHRSLEQHVRAGQLDQHACPLGQRGKSNVPGLQRRPPEDADLPRQRGYHAAAAELPGDDEGVGGCVWVQL